MSQFDSVRVSAGGLLILAGALHSGFAMAQPSWPNRPVRVVVPFSPGGGTDIQARLLSKFLSESLGQNFIVENRVGASGLIGAEAVARSPSDGLTILMTTASLAVNSTLYAGRLKFDPQRDLWPVVMVSSGPLVLVTHPNVPAKTVTELIAAAKRSPKGLEMSSNGAGTTSHLSLEMLKQAGLNAVHVPYRGGAPAVSAIVSGEIDAGFVGTFSALPQLRNNRLRGLAVSTLKRSTVLPDLPTVASTIPGFESDNWYAIFVPDGTSRDIINRLNAEVNKGLGTREVREAIANDGGEVAGGTIESLAATFKREVQRYAEVIRKGNIKVE